MSTAKNLVGDRFGRVVVLERAGADKHNRALWLCQCDCGNTCIVATNRLTNGTTKSCGCYAKELFQENSKKPVHGMYKSRPFSIWHSMKQRCLNPNCEQFEYYGGKGVKVCEKWMTFTGFWEDMKNGYSDELTLDRIDGNGNYERSNCRWATRQEQSENKSSNVCLTIDGITAVFKRHCERYGINYSTAYNRVYKHGYSYEDAIKIPTKSKFASREIHPKGD